MVEIGTWKANTLQANKTAYSILLSLITILFIKLDSKKKIEDWNWIVFPNWEVKIREANRFWQKNSIWFILDILSKKIYL